MLGNFLLRPALKVVTACCLPVDGSLTTEGRKAHMSCMRSIAREITSPKDVSVTALNLVIRLRSREKRDVCIAGIQ